MSILYSRIRRQNNLQDSNTFLSHTSQKNKCNHYKADIGHVVGDGMVHISDYGFAHVWEIQQLEPGVGGAETIIDSQDTMSTYTGANCPSDTVLSIATNKDALPLCDHSNKRVLPLSTNRNLLPLSDTVLPITCQKAMLPSCASCRERTSLRDTWETSLT